MFDGLGSERTVPNSPQTVTGTAIYEGFGQTVATTGTSSNPYMFAATSGYRNDGDAGLMHVGARYYDAQVGRFITRDTLLSQHPYLYCEHDPVNLVDPTGHEGTFSISAGDIGIIGTIGGGANVSILISTKGDIGLSIDGMLGVGVGLGDSLGIGIGYSPGGISTGTYVNKIVTAFIGVFGGIQGAVTAPAPGPGFGPVNGVSGSAKIGPTFGGGILGGIQAGGSVKVGNPIAFIRGAIHSITFGLL